MPDERGNIDLATRLSSGILTIYCLSGVGYNLFAITVFATVNI